MFSPAPCPPDKIQIASSFSTKYSYAASKRSTKERLGTSPYTRQPSTTTVAFLSGELVADQIIQIDSVITSIAINNKTLNIPRYNHFFCCFH